MREKDRLTVVLTPSGFRWGAVDVDRVGSNADGSVVIGLYTGRCAPVQAQVSADGQSIEVWQGDQLLANEDELAAELDRVQEVADYAKQRIDDALALCDENVGYPYLIDAKAIRGILRGDSDRSTTEG